MSQRQRKTSHWQEAPTRLEQLALIPTALEELIPHDHPVRLVDEILDQINWTRWEADYHDAANEDLLGHDAANEDLLGQDTAADRLPAAIAASQSRREQLAARLETVPGMDDVRKKNGTKGPAQLPKTDPESRILPNKEGGCVARMSSKQTLHRTSKRAAD